MGYFPGNYLMTLFNCILVETGKSAVSVPGGPWFDADSARKCGDLYRREGQRVIVVNLKDQAEEIERTCPNCGGRMEDRACKLVCRCGYFKSCGEF